MKEIKIFSPATVANVSCGFDVLGFCLDSVGDEMTVRKTEQKGIRITRIDGYDLPLNVDKNVAGISAMALYNHANPECGFDIEIDKKIKPGSGIGSSSASASGAVFALNKLLGNPYDKKELTAFAMVGETFASGSKHADNVAPALFGGFTLVKSLDPLVVLELPTPDNLFATMVHPQIEIKTSEARAILPDKIALKSAITQWSNVGSLVHALHTNDHDLIASSLEDVVVEPYRSQLIPLFNDIKTAALQKGALGCGISGSGPSIFALSSSMKRAMDVEAAIHEIYGNSEIEYYTFISKINKQGIKVI